MYARGLDGSRSAAIWLYCLECVAWSPSEVRACTAPACVLYSYRHPGSRSAIGRENAPDPLTESTDGGIHAG
jgi:hypothetical protein